MAPENTDIFPEWKCQRAELVKEAAGTDKDFEYSLVPESADDEYLHRNKMQIVRWSDFRKDMPKGQENLPARHMKSMVVKRPMADKLQDDRDRCEPSRRRVRRTVKDKRNTDGAKWEPKDSIAKPKSAEELIHPSEIEDRFDEEERFNEGSGEPKSKRTVAV